MKNNGSSLPDGWRRIQVKDICSKIDYGYTAKANPALKEPKFLRITDIQDGNVNWDETPGCEIDPATEKKKKLQSGDIVFARTGSVGKSYLIVNPPRAVFASYLIRLQIREIATPEYVYHFFQSNDYWQQIGLNVRGGVQSNVNATRLGNLTLPLPPLSEQKMPPSNAGRLAQRKSFVCKHKRRWPFEFGWTTDVHCETDSRAVRDGFG